MKRKDITDKIFFVAFDDKVEAAKTFLRFQEYYENPEFKGKTFSLLEFARFYKKENGEFSYYKDWSGFNIPSYVLTPFRDGTFKNLSKREKAILEMFKDDVGDFYIIACQQDKQLDIDHEVMHGLYYTNLFYKCAVHDILEIQEEVYPGSLDIIYDLLEFEGYHKDVVKDECHAYLGDLECRKFLQQNAIDMTKYALTAKALNENYKNYMSKYADISSIS